MSYLLFQVITVQMAPEQLKNMTVPSVPSTTSQVSNLRKNASHVSVGSTAASEGSLIPTRLAHLDSTVAQERRMPPPIREMMLIYVLLDIIVQRE